MFLQLRNIKAMENSCILISIVICLYSIESSFAELKLLQVVFRHGNRAPTASANIFPMDPFGNETFLPEGRGGLTNIGKMSSFELGKFYRERYGKFLGPVYKSDIIHFRADEKERIVMTAQLVAAAMFPPHPSQRWNPHLNWQPIPVWTMPIENDLLYNGLFCSNHKKWRVEVETHNQNVQKFKQLNKERLQYLSKHTGTNITIFKSFFLRQLLYAEMDVGLKLPEWTNSIFPNKSLDELAIFSLKLMSETNEMKQVVGGRWIGEFLNHVNDYINKTKRTSKAYMYAAHELNIAPILIALNNFDNRIPSYSSTVVFELHEMENKLHVQDKSILVLCISSDFGNHHEWSHDPRLHSIGGKVEKFLRSKYTLILNREYVIHKDQDRFRILEIPGCHQKMCPLVVFQELVKHIIPENPKKLCGDFVRNIF